MEYSPMMVVMLWALTPSDCLPTGTEPSEQARVVEMPQPIMSVHPEGYFTFNHGRPFLAERDPLTGAVDSNIKTTPVTSDDYLYEEYEESGESIDRKDNSKIYSRNDITTSSKESDLHKFLNLPVHYSSSGKFPLISSSYANTKVQGHGPLSNHKMHISSTSTTTTISPTYYTLKTKPSSTTTEKLTTTKVTTISTLKTTTPSTTSLPLSTQRTTFATTTTTPTKTTKAPSIKTTTTLKPLSSNYEYEYEYDYDKSDGDGTENSSHDYEFLGASSEVMISQNKFTNTVNPVKISSSVHSVPNITKEATTLPPSTSVSPTTSKVITASLEKIHSSNTEIKTIFPVKNEKEQQNYSKITNFTESTSLVQDDIIDLKPPKPILSVELTPPQVQPNRPFIVTTKPSLPFGPFGFDRYPESPLMFEDKKPFTVYSPQNNTKSNQDVIPTTFKMPIEESRPQEEQQISSSQYRPYTVHLIQNKTPNKVSTEANVISTTIQNHSQTEANIEKTVDKMKNSSSQNNKKNQQALSNIGNKPKPSVFPNYNLAVEKPSESNKISLEEIKRPDNNYEADSKRPPATTPHNRHEELKIPSKPEHRPQGLPKEPSIQGLISIGHNRPLQDQRPPMPSQTYPKPSNIVQRPQESISEHTRLPIKPKPENRPQVASQPFNNKPFIHYSPEHKPVNYQFFDPNIPHTHMFGLRITERPSVPERISSMEQLRPVGVGKPQVIQYETKKPVNSADTRPHQSLMGSEIRPVENNQRPEGNSKPVIFSKPQSGKRPDYNTVQFGQPSKVENHFISVSSGNDNPSYSLQTSFSIGVPPSEQKQVSSVSHGVGQVLFPDEESEKKPSPLWPHPRPPQINPNDPHSNVPVEKYPRPPWESHLKPTFIYHKKEQFPPIKRKPLPNILPQFRPNAKIGYAEPHVYLKPREPYDTLQPPPLPRPQYLRPELDIEETIPLVHRRNGQSTTKVTTLQMMQGSPTSKRAALRIDDTNEKNEPVFVVYPSNNGNTPPSSPSDGVVVGTRGPQRPLPPDNLDIGDDLDSFPLDNNKNFQARVDTPVLKSKSSTSKPVIKNDFPYTLIKPIPDERITPGSVVTKEYTAFSPTVPSTEKEHDTEINIIPYLQDYMPFATKKPAHKDTWLLGSDIKHLSSATTGPKQPGSEITPGPYKNENHRVVSEGPQPQDFQAPFHASLTAPSQGWSVVQKKPHNEKPNEEISTTKESNNEVQTTEETKFDIQNFKPQLFGGFKPIVPPVDNEKKENLNI